MKNNLIVFIKLFILRFQQNKLPVSAGYLTYNTMLAIVPLIMVVFSIFAAFPIFEQFTAELKLFIYDNFAPNASNVVQEYLEKFVNNSKQMSAIGIIGLVVVALMLMFNIDNTLNDIWHNTKRRPKLISFAVYWTILTLGPLLVGGSLAISSYLISLKFFNFETSGQFLYKLLNPIPFLLTWLLFMLVYAIVPNTKVKLTHSTLGALIAAVLFNLSKLIFVWYITAFPSYQIIYGTLSILPIMIIWIHLSWLIVLSGALFTAVLEEYSFSSSVADCHKTGQEIT